jgi:ABC-type bacteriocin/lantibiotic exporter with double-glycine peptidase domain
VIIAVRSFNRPQQGHFVVAVHVDDDTVDIMDPNTPGNWRRLDHRELDRRWRFRDRYGVLVLPMRGTGRAQLGEAGGEWMPWAVAGGTAAALAAAIWIGRRG